MSAELSVRQAALILNALPALGPAAVQLLLAAGAGDPRAFLGAGSRPPGGLRPEAAAALADWRRQFDLPREEERLAKSGADLVVLGDADYPALLREIPDPPLVLYRKGTLAGGHPCVTLVGSRTTTLYGETVARQLAGELARRGFCIVSGLARGIDAAAHEGALAAGGLTAAVLGTGLDVVHPPEHLALYRRIAEAGVVYSEFPFGRRADRPGLVQRSRLLSGLSAAVVVVESARDGGALLTARFAGEQGRTVFAVPGRIDQATSAGCHQLIRDGATLVTGVEDILSELNYLGGRRPLAIAERAGPGTAAQAGLTAAERAVLAAVDAAAGIAPAGLAAATQLPAEQIAAALVLLEGKRLVARRADGTYVASD